MGTELQRSFSDAGEITAWDRKAADLSRPEDLRSIIGQLRPAVILNAAAYTAVDRAESEAELAMTINGHAPRVLAEEAAKLDALLVHYSTDYVFDGSKKSPWVETRYYKSAEYLRTNQTGWRGRDQGSWRQISDLSHELGLRTARP